MTNRDDGAVPRAALRPNYLYSGGNGNVKSDQTRGGTRFVVK